MVRLAVVVLCALLCAALLAPADASAQEVDAPERFELPWEEPEPNDVDLPESGAFLAADDCRLYRADRNRSLSWPIGGLPSTGTLTAAILFVQFEGFPSGAPPSDDFVDALFDPGLAYFDQVSQGRLEIDLKPHPVWLTASRPHTDYAIGGVNGPVTRTDFIHEVAALADPAFDFSDVDAIWIVAAPTPDFFLSRAGGGGQLQLDGKEIRANMTLMAPSPSTALHEALHNLGLPDLYDTSFLDPGSTNTDDPRRFVGGFDPMSISSFTHELLSWQRWLLGWIDDDQIDCLTDLPSSTALAPLGAPGGTKAAVMRVDQHRVIVTENRQRVGYDDTPFFEETGLLVYVVDASVSSGRGPIKVLGERHPLFGLDSSVLLQPGESIAVLGYVIEATQGPDGLEAVVLEACVDTIPTINMNTNGGDGTGTEGDDIIVGTRGDDVINGLGGNDIICGGGGNDVINGGAGDDVIRAGQGDDEVRGSSGDDIIEGGQGNDKLFGTQGDDEIQGGPGDDIIHGNKGEDHLSGGAGADRIFGYADSDQIFGGPGDDRLHGNFGDDMIDGGVGDDRIWGYGDEDQLSGGDGNDLLVGNFGDDVIEGGEGNDLLYGSDGSDRLFGGYWGPIPSVGVDRLFGNSGDDVVVDEARTGSVDGGIGRDTCFGAAPIRCEQII